jgi:ABC-2 type transport system permease protein
MNYSIVNRLILKDWYLNRPLIVASGSQIAVILAVIVLVTILIGMGAFVNMTVVMERKMQTLSFVMSLPISYREYTASKIIGSLVIFLVLWFPLIIGVIGAILLIPGFPHGLIPFIVITGVEMLVSTCLITAVAVTTESQGWAIGVTQLGGLALNAFGFYVAHLHNIGGTMSSSSVHWSTTATLLLLAESAAIALLLGLAFLFQSRKKDFL